MSIYRCFPDHKVLYVDLSYVHRGDIMLVGIIMCGSRQTVLPEQIIALEKVGCERFHIVDHADDLDRLRQALAPSDLLIAADPSQGVREVRLH